MARNISFNGTSLQTNYIMVDSIGDAGLPDKNLSIFELGHANASRVVYESYPQRRIQVSGTIIGDTVSDLDGRLDSLKYALTGIDKNLDVDYGTGSRRYIASLNSLSIDRPGGLLYATFQIEFVCSSPFGRDLTTTNALSVTGRTAASYTDNYTFVGTAPWQQPIVTITITALTGGTGQAVSFGNNSNGQQISVTRTWTAGDVLLIDCSAKTVMVNSVAVDFSGAFPEFPPGAATFAYADGLTTRTFNIDVSYYPMWL